MEKDLNKLRDRAYKIACEHGFPDKEYSDAHWLMLVITEISEAVEADRKGNRADKRSFLLINQRSVNRHKDQEYFNNIAFKAYIKDSLEDELADVVIRLLDFAGVRKIDLDELNSMLNVEHYKICLGGQKQDFTEEMFDMTGFLFGSTSIKDNIYCCIGGAFSVAYKYHINLFQHMSGR